jgi:hypothetical protein
MLPIDSSALCREGAAVTNRGLLKDRVRQCLGKPGARPWARLGLCLGVVVLVVAMLILMFGGSILNGFGKRHVERAFAATYPGYALRIGELDYSVLANCLVAQSVTLSTTNSTLKVGRIALTGVRWARLLAGRSAPADVLAKASLDATYLDMEFRLAQRDGSEPPQCVP